MAVRGYVAGRYGQVHYREAGPRTGAPTLICFHLSPMSGRIYETFIDARARHGRRAVAFDTPGFGMSDAPPALPSIEDYGDALAEAIAALDGDGPVDLMGYHTGSMIAAHIAATRPSLVRRIVLVSAPVFTDAELQAMRTLYARHEPALDGSHLLRRWNSFTHHYLGRGLALEQAADMFPDGLLGRGIEWWGHNAAFAFDLATALARVTQPVLLINPGDDLQAETRRAPPLIADCTLAERPDWGHGFLETETAEAVQLVDAFLDA